MSEEFKIIELNENDIIEKANCLLFLKDDPFGLIEIKLLDAYLSKINARDDTQTVVRFSKKEFEKIIGVDRIRPENAKRYTDSLIRPVDVKIPTQKGEESVYARIALFDLASCTRDSSGKYWFELGCSQRAKQYIFNIDNIGYLQYRLGNVVKLTSKHSLSLFLYVSSNLFRKKWKIELKELKHILRCKPTSYKEYKDFNKCVLREAVEEINEKTDVYLQYNAIRELGPKTQVTHIEFIVGLKEVTSIVNREIKKLDNKQDKEIKELCGILDISIHETEILWNKSKELNIEYADVKLFAEYIKTRKNIKNRTGYMMKILSEPYIQSSIRSINPRTIGFCDFPQRKYDDELDELEVLFQKELFK